MDSENNDGRNENSTPAASGNKDHTEMLIGMVVHDEMGLDENHEEGGQRVDEFNLHSPIHAVEDNFSQVEAMAKDNSRLIPELIYPVPVIGSIKMGEIITREGGGKLPKKNPYFLITSQTKARNKENNTYEDHWMPHPLEAGLLSNKEYTHNIQGEPRLKDIPVRIMFNDPALTMSERYEAVSKDSGRIICASIGGGQAKTFGAEGLKTVSCPGPANCEFGRNNRCKLRGRIHLQIEGQDDPLSAFLLRTSGYNSVRTMRTKLKNLFDMTDGKIAHMPMILRLRVKLTPKGEIFYGDLVFRKDLTLAATIRTAKEALEGEQNAGINRKAYETGMLQLLRNGAYEDTEEDAVEIEDWEGQIGDGSETKTKSATAKPTTQSSASVALTEFTQSSQESGQTEQPEGLHGLKNWLETGKGGQACVTN